MWITSMGNHGAAGGMGGISERRHSSCSSSDLLHGNGNGTAVLLWHQPIFFSHHNIFPNFRLTKISWKFLIHQCECCKMAIIGATIMIWYHIFRFLELIRRSVTGMHQWTGSSLAQITSGWWKCSSVTLGSNYSEIVNKMQQYSLTIMPFKMLSAYYQPFCLALILLTPQFFLWLPHHRGNKGRGPVSL